MDTIAIATRSTPRLAKYINVACIHPVQSREAIPIHDLFLYFCIQRFEK